MPAPGKRLSQGARDAAGRRDAILGRARRAEVPAARRLAPFRPRLVVFAKAPVAGSVKTRLARELGLAVATRFARQSAAALLARVGGDRRWQTIIAATGGSHCGGRFWPRAFATCAQGGGTLGERMQRILEGLPPGPVVIVGTDIPQLRAQHIAEAFRALGRHDVVLGPAADGGYWLIGLRRRPRVLSPFGGVRWSSAHALADTLANLGGRSVFRLARLGDVDDAHDFALYAAGCGRRVPPSAATAPSSWHCRSGATSGGPAVGAFRRGRRPAA